MKRPKKKNWQSVNKATLVADKNRNDVRPFWVKSYDAISKGHWLFRTSSDDDMLKKFNKDVDSMDFRMVEMGIYRNNKQVLMQRWLAQSQAAHEFAAILSKATER